MLSTHKHSTNDRNSYVLEPPWDWGGVEEKVGNQNFINQVLVSRVLAH